MNKFSSFLKNAFSSGIKLFKTHPISMIVLLLLTAAGFSFPIVEEVSGTGLSLAVNALAQVLVFLTVFLPCCFLIETLGLKNRVLKVILVVAGALVSFVFSTFLEDAPVAPGIGSSALKSLGLYAAIALILGIVIILWILIIYFCYKKCAEVSFAEYMMRVFSKVFMRGIIYSVISNGILILTLIFAGLLWGDFGVIFFPAEILVMGVFYLPAILEALVYSDEEEIGFIKVLVRYVFLILTLLAYVIIYIYMIKITVTWDIPSNSIFAILTALFIVSMVIAYMCTAYERKGFLQNTAYFLPLIFVPFIGLQCYSVFVRIIEHGLTASRLFGVGFIIFEIIYIVLYLLRFFGKKELKGETILPIIAAMVFVLACVPGGNAFHFSSFVDRITIKSGIESFSNGSNDSAKIKKAVNLYDYLNKEEKHGNIPSSDVFSASDAEKIENMREYLIENPVIDYFEEDSTGKYNWWTSDTSWIDVSGYDRIIEVDFRMNQYNFDDSDGWNNVELYESGEGQEKVVRIVDMSVLAAEITDFVEKDNTSKSHSGEGNLDENNVIQIDDTSKFILKSVNVTYDTNPLKLTDVSGTGYYLTK